MEFDSTDDLLDFVSDGGVARTHAPGYEWFWNTLQPALAAVQPKSEKETERLADCHYVCGDVHDFNNAPLAAIEEYKKAIALDPDHASAFREIANMQHNFGDLENARVNIDKALALDPKDEYSILDHKYICESLKDPDFTPLYEEKDLVWRAYEELAKPDPEKALDILRDDKSDEAVRARICALGALGRHDLYLASWRDCLKAVSKVEFEQADFFFIPEAVHDAPELWKLFLDSKVEFGGVFADFESLSDNGDYKLLSINAKIRRRMEYFLYEPVGDKDRLKKLHDAYPEWVEVAEALKS